MDSGRNGLRKLIPLRRIGTLIIISRKEMPWQALLGRLTRQCPNLLIIWWVILRLEMRRQLSSWRKRLVMHQFNVKILHLSEVLLKDNLKTSLTKTVALWKLSAMANLLKPASSFLKVSKPTVTLAKNLTFGSSSKSSSVATSNLTLATTSPTLKIISP